MVNEYDKINGFFLPQNEYFIDTFDDAEKGIRESNQYSIFNPEGNAVQPIIELSSQYSDIKINFKTNISYETDSATGFLRYSINEDINETIYFSIISSGKKANYMIIYYLNENYIDHNFELDSNFVRKDNGDKNQSLTDISFEFNGIFVSNYSDDIIFYITGTLYKENKDIIETINNTCFLLERENEKNYTNKAISIFNKTNEKSSSWTLIFTNIPRSENYIYDLRLQMIASIINDNSQEEYMTYTLKVNLTDIKKNEPIKSSWLPWGIPLIVVGSILVIIIIIYFVIKFLKLKKKNDNLKKEMVSLAFSHDIQKNVLMKDKELSVNESDYESTFI
jgi:hypothetical protein